jgi:signal transduction histidine kinase/DNA-binding response OmpR family regulator
MSYSPTIVVPGRTPKDRPIPRMPGSDTISILVVDDLPDKLMVFETVLEQLGVNIVTARSGDEALRCVLENNFAVILLDVNMPGMDGYETARFIRQRKKSAHTPIIFITAYAEQVQLLEGYTVGAVDYIFSPIVPEILRSKVQVFVDLFRMTEHVKRQADEQVNLAKEQAARAAAEEAIKRSSFLAEAAMVLGSSLDVAATQRALARLAAPFLAELCAVTMADENGCPGGTELACYPNNEGVGTVTLREPQMLPPVIRQAVEKVLATGRGITLENPCTDGESAAIDDNHDFAAGRWPTSFPLRTVSVLPLLASGRTIGALTLAMGPSKPKRAWADRTLAEDLAGRAAIALENARLYQNIQETDRRKNAFLVMLAHELRNPLAPIQNAVQILERVRPKADRLLTEARAVISRQVNHMARLIDDLLDMSRLARGSILLRTEPVDLVELVRTTCEDYRPLLERSDLQLDVRLPERTLTVEGDPTRLAQIVGNVLHNASKFTDGGGTVTVEVAARPKKLARVVVRDTGIGIEPEMLSRVFETFTQADNSLDRRRGGLGLGLTLVKGLVELHGGQVWVKSDGPGKGAEVTIQLPLTAAPTAPPATARPIADDRKLRVLVVEDNRDTAETLRLLFSMSGHDVAVAHNGADAIETARSFRPEVVLCDIGLPGDMNGYDLAQLVRKDAALAGMHLIALTGYGQEQDQERSRHAGFDAHLTKPVEFTDLERILAGLPARV